MLSEGTGSFGGAVAAAGVGFAHQGRGTPRMHVADCVLVAIAVAASASAATATSKAVQDAIRLFKPSDCWTGAGSDDKTSTSDGDQSQ